MDENISARVAYGFALERFGDRDNVYVFDADLESYTMTQYPSEKYPERFSNIGIAGANMIGVTVGFTTCGAASLVHTFAMPAVGRIYDQIRNSVVYPGLNVKIVGSHAGLTVDEDGVSHQCIEGTSLIRTIPKVTVIIPYDSHETRLVTKAVLKYEGPYYLRISRCALDCVADNLENYKSEIGKGVQLADGTDVTIIACDLMVQKSLKARKILEVGDIGARVIDMHTIKPIGRDTIVKVAEETGAIVTTERYNVIGGLGGSISEIIVGTKPAPIEFIGMEDKFGHSDVPKELLESLGLTSEHIAVAAKQTIQRKK